jgi:hypothetical protein
MPPVEFEPAIPASGRPQTHALGRTVTGIGLRHNIKTNPKTELGRAMAQAVSRRPLTTEARVRSQVKSM